MNESMQNLFKDEGIKCLSHLPFSLCRVTRPYLYEKKGLVPQSVLVFLIPYYAGEPENFSAYAMGKDYHLFARELEERILPKIKALYPEYDFLMFADHSPLDERHAAVLGGLGVFGKNGLVLNEYYGSYHFIGEILTDAPTKAFGRFTLFPLASCLNCGACEEACPTEILRGEGKECLSAITQKKGELSEAEKALMKKENTAWGCDACQRVCPYNVRAKEVGSIFSPIPFFNEGLFKRFDSAMLSALDEKAFAQRAFSWRGREVAERNAKILEE